MRRILDERNVFGGLMLVLAGVSPNLFPLAQAGFAEMSWLGKIVLLPSVVLLAALIGIAAARGHRALVRRALGGAAAGVIATIGLEVVRTVSFRLGGMPGDMPRLLGVLLTNRFMLGPSALSDFLGYAYHFWNGAMFGLIFGVVAGKKPLVYALVYAQLIGVGFLVSPAVKALGIGFMGFAMPTMPVTVVLAHGAFGFVLGLFTRRWLGEPGESEKRSIAG